MNKIISKIVQLDAGGIDEISEQIAEALSEYPYLARRDIIRLQLSAEDFMLHWMNKVSDAEVELNIEKKGRWLNLSLTLVGPSYRCTPLSEDGSKNGGLADNLLASLGIDWIYQFDNGQNNVYISVEVEHNHRVQLTFLGMGLGVLTGLILRLIGQNVADTAAGYVIEPLFNMGSRFLTAIVSPMMLLAVIDGILSVGTPKGLDKVGRNTSLRFLLATFIVILCAGLMCTVCFPFQWTFKDENGTSSLIAFITEIVPNDIFSPFIECNMLQIVFIGTIIGIAMLFLQRQVRTLGHLVEEANTLICRLIVGFEKALPIFVYLSMTNTALTTDVDALIAYVRAVVFFLIFIAVVMGVQFMMVKVRVGISLKEIWEIVKPSFMVQLASASSSAAFTEAYDACEQGLGVDEKLVRFALPIGTVIHKPLIAAEFVFLIAAIEGLDGVGLNMGSLLILMLVAFLVSVSYPPVIGGEIFCYPMLLSQMGLDGGFLATACTLSSLLDTFEAPNNTLSVEFEIALAAKKHGMIDCKASNARN